VTAHSTPSAPALDAVSLTIRHGETVAFVGPNGSGKTTLLSLIPRLLDPDQGSVLIDNRDIREVGIRSLRRQIGVVTQDTVLFRGSIRWNIAYGAAGLGLLAGDDEDRLVKRAAQAARAEEFILEKQGGYDAPIGEGGVGFSGGQRQRLTIARALSRDPAILILDEATSMVDAESEARIAEAIAEFSKGRTSLIVAHRLSTVVNADRIVVMDAGRIVDIGRHDELLARCAVYRTIAENQLF
jgi:subfamily B ATP-binding cassette protein MsbA